MAQTTSLVFNGGVIPSPSPAPAGSGKAKLLKIGEISIVEQEVQVTKKVICDPDSITTIAPFMEVLTSAKLAELISANSILVLDDGTVQYLMADATVVAEDGTSVCTSVNFLGLSLEDRAKVLYPCTRVTNELTLQQVLEVGEPVKTSFDLVKAYPEDTEAGTLIDKLEIEDNSTDPDWRPILEIVPTDHKVAINEDNLREALLGINESIDGIIETIGEMDVDSVQHAYLHSTLNQSAGDSVTTSTTINVFAQDALEGDCFEFEQTTTIDDTPFGYVWIEPGTYLINASVTLQWVGDPRGTFIAKVGSVMGENFDFSQEQELKRQSTKVVTIPSRMKLAVNVTYDAGTPVMGFWIQSMQVVKLAGGMSQTNIIHNDTLAGQGSVADPLGVDEEKVAQSTLAGNLALAFDETGETDYTAGTPVVRGGKTYVFKVDHSGAWSSSDVKEVDAREIFFLKKDFNDAYNGKDGLLVEKLKGFYSTPNSSGVSAFTSSDAWLSLKFKVEKLTRYKVFGEKGFTQNNPNLIFVDGDGKFFVSQNLASSVIDNSFEFINNHAEYAIIQISATSYENTIYRFEKYLDLKPILFETPFNIVASDVEPYDWRAVSDEVTVGSDPRYIRSKITLNPFTTYRIEFFKSGSVPEIVLCCKDETDIIQYISSSSDISTQAYPLDLYICSRIFQGTDFDVLNKISVVEKSRQDDFKPLCNWVASDSNMIAGWYDASLVIHDSDKDLKHQWNIGNFAHSTPIPVTAGQYEFKGQGIGTSNPIVLKCDENGVVSSDFMILGLGLGNSTPYRHIFNIPEGVDYVTVVGSCGNGKPNSNFYLRRLYEDKSESLSHNAVSYASVTVHTKDVRTITDNQITNGVIVDNGSTDTDRIIVMYPEKVVQGKRKLVVFFHGSGEPVNSSSWNGLNKFMPNFFAAMGYVVCACNGMPSDFATAHNLSYSRPVGNYMWIESACRMVEKVCREFDCDPNEIYVYGESQGGMGALNFVECSGIKVRACVVDSPATSMLYSQLNISGALTNMLYFYGFDDATGYSPDKVYGLDPFARNCDKIEDKNDYTITGTWLSETELLKVKSHRTSQCPIKFFLGSDDYTTPAFVSQIVYRQLKNAGQMVACNLYNGIGHCVDQNSPVIGTFTYRGGTYNITQPAIDMVNWWARFGGYSELPAITPIS